MTRIERETHTVGLMVRLYCRAHHVAPCPCPECDALIAYATARLAHCPWGEEKPSCQRCPKHCYRPAQREAIRRVMRYAGPRMVVYHPLAALRHWLSFDF